MKFAVIGAGNGGQAIAGYLGLNNYSVTLFDRNSDKVKILSGKGGIQLEGKIKGFGKIDLITNVLSEAVQEADVIMVTTVANAHKELAVSLAPLLHTS